MHSVLRESPSTMRTKSEQTKPNNGDAAPTFARQNKAILSVMITCFFRVSNPLDQASLTKSPF